MNQIRISMIVFFGNRSPGNNKQFVVFVEGGVRRLYAPHPAEAGH